MLAPQGYGPGGLVFPIFFLPVMPERVCFLIDGFNVYHSLLDAMQVVRAPLKWLNLNSLCRSYLSVIGPSATVVDVYYFSALAEYRLSDDPEVVNRHKLYIEALSAHGIKIKLGQFKLKHPKCSLCCRQYATHEEKKTDVTIAVRMIELFMRDQCDWIALISGDTDHVASIEEAKRLFPGRKICVGFPFNRVNEELKAVADRHFRIKPAKYQAHQLPDPLNLADGRILRMPSSWANIPKQRARQTAVAIRANTP